MVHPGSMQEQKGAVWLRAFPDFGQDLADSLTFGDVGSIQIRDDGTNTVVAERQWPPSDAPGSWAYGCST